MVYLLHLERKLAHSQHYIGWTESGRTLPERIKHHQSGNGARFLQVTAERGIKFDVVRTWKHGDRKFERRLKNCKNASRFCPICNPDGWQKQYPEEEK